MSDKKISQLNPASSLTGVEELAVVQSNTTKKATIDQIKTYVEGGQTYDTLFPTVISVQDGDVVDLSNVGYDSVGFIQLKWVGGSGNQNMDIILPPCISSSTRVFRFITNGSFTSNTHAHLLGAGTDTIDGVASYTINKDYEGVQVWTDGIEWSVIQAKSH